MCYKGPESTPPQRKAWRNLVSYLLKLIMLFLKSEQNSKKKVQIRLSCLISFYGDSLKYSIYTLKRYVDQTVF